MAETSNTTREGDLTSGVTTSKTTQPGELTSESVEVIIELKCHMTAAEGARAVIKACEGVKDCSPKFILPKNCDSKPQLQAQMSDWDLDWY